jgi:hypothetical protein
VIIELIEIFSPVGLPLVQQLVVFLRKHLKFLQGFLYD